MRRLRVFAAALLLLAAAAACAADRVLMLTLPEASVEPAAVQRALQERVARGAAPLALEVRQITGDPLAPVNGRLPDLPLAGPYSLIFATSMSLARAAQLRDSTTPIVFEGSADAMLMCLVDSVSRPGRNATGYTSALPDGAKLLDTLVDGFPALREVVMLVSGHNLHPADCRGGLAAVLQPPPACRPGLRQPDAFMERLLQTAPLREQAARRGVALRFALLCDAADLALINRLATRGVGFIVPYHFLFFDNARNIIQRIGAVQRPAVYGATFFGPLGGLITVDTIADALDDGASIELAMKVLDGRAPAEMPVLMPRGFRVTVNAWAAAAQGLHPSLALLRRADHVIVQPPRR